MRRDDRHSTSLVDPARLGTYLIGVRKSNAVGNTVDMRTLPPDRYNLTTTRRDDRHCISLVEAQLCTHLARVRESNATDNIDKQHINQPDDTSIHNTKDNTHTL